MEFLFFNYFVSFFCFCFFYQLIAAKLKVKIIIIFIMFCFVCNHSLFHFLSLLLFFQGIVPKFYKPKIDFYSFLIFLNFPRYMEETNIYQDFLNTPNISFTNHQNPKFCVLAAIQLWI